MGKKKNCYGCKAYDESFRSCDLGYSITNVPINVIDKNGKLYMAAVHTPTPAEDCPKPKTFNQLFNARRKGENS